MYRLLPIVFAGGAANAEIITNGHFSSLRVIDGELMSSFFSQILISIKVILQRVVPPLFSVIAVHLKSKYTVCGPLMFSSFNYAKQAVFL